MCCFSTNSIYSCTCRPPPPSAGSVTHSYRTYLSNVRRYKAHHHLNQSTQSLAHLKSINHSAAQILAKTHDIMKWATYLSHHGQYVYVPNSDTISHSNRSNTPSAKTDSTAQDVNIYKPTYSFSYSTGDQTITGVAQWKSLSYAKGDWPWWAGAGTNIGGPDSVGLDFSYLPNPSQIVSQDAITSNSLGSQTSYMTTWDTAQGPSGQFTAQWQGQDKVVQNWKGNLDYSWYQALGEVTFNPYWNGSGNVTTTYAHNWNQTNFTGFSFNGGTTGDQLSYGLTVTYSNQSYQWAANSLYYHY